ncbi:MAG TPA: IS110 family transposase [Candidatus Dormibacteraeota bacterium]
MAIVSIAQAHDPLRVVVGVDTHKNSHVGHAKDVLGRDLGHLEIPTTVRGYAALMAWARGFGEVTAFGVEGTSSYGIGLARYLQGEGQLVLEVIRPGRQDRRFRGKSDPLDAEAAAAAVLSGKARHLPRASGEKVEMIRALRIARTSATKARTQAINAIKALIVMAPEPVRCGLRDLPTARLVNTCAHFRTPRIDDPTSATKAALRSLALRYQALAAEVRELEVQLDRLTSETDPLLRSRFGVGPDSAAALLLAAGDNPARLRSDSSFSMLCGASPLLASSGQTNRHRLNRGGDRQANSALHRIVMARLRWHEPTQAYMRKRTAEGKSKPEVIRCLKRYVAREIYTVLMSARGQA